MTDPVRNSLLLGVAAVAIVATPAPAQAQSLDTRFAFDIPAQPVADALLAFSRQSNIQVVSASADVGSRRSRAVRGTMASRSAIDRLLEGSGLSWREAGGGSVVVEPASGEAIAGSAAADDGSVDGDQAGVAEILVVGSRSQNVDIARSEDDPQPYVVFGREEIQRSQATNLEEFFRTRLPMNTQQASNATGGGPAGLDPGAYGNTSQFNLRGLGTNQTLVLIDGRRVPRVVTSSLEFTQGDLNGIPLASIERIEVLPSTAGGIYGGGAVGGVINIVRRRDYRGVEFRASYQGTFRGGGESYELGITGGFSPDGGRTRVSFAGSWSDARPLYADDNDLWRRGRELYVANDPLRSLFAGYTPNIRSVNGANLILDNGTLLNSPFTHIPVGYPGALAAGDNGAALVANAGQYSFGLSSDTVGRRSTLRSDPRVRSANVNVRRELFPAVEIFTDFTISENLSRSTYSGILASTRINANAPNNPFRQDINVIFPLIGTEQPARVETNALAATAGLIVRPARHWSATLEYGFGRVATQGDYVTGRPIQTTADAAIRTGVLDVLRDLNRYPLDYSTYLSRKPDSSPLETRQEIISARLAGQIVDLPAGPLAVNALMERRVNVAAPYQLLTATTLTYLPRRSQSIHSGYAELLIPIFSDRNAAPFAQALELQISTRHDRYRTRSTDPAIVTLTLPNTQLPAFGEVENRFGSTDVTVAARWSPIRDISIRASYATGFLPASISQLVFTERPAAIQLFTDPRRGNETNVFRTYTSRSGGGADLLPERSKSFSLGLVVTPSFLPGFRFSTDYTSIQKTDEINAPTEQDILNNETLFPGRIERGPNLPGDPAGWAGPITLLDATLTNFARSRVESLDFQADYEFESRWLGRFHIYALATHQLRLRRQFLPTTAPYDLVGAFEGPLDWRGNAGIDWRLGGWRAGWNAQFFNSYSVLFADPVTRAVVGNLGVVRQGSDRIPNQVYHDVYVGYDFPAGHQLSGTRVSLGVQNLFDRKPPVIAAALGGYSRYGDPRLRRFTLTLSKAF